MTKIYLSPSDQADNVYACGGTTEAEQCRKIANACEVALKRCGFDVKNGQSGSYVDRTNESNAWNADLHLCIHTNAFNGKTDGLRMFYYNEGGPSYKACKSIYDVLVKIVPGTSSNMRANQELYEMYYTNCASVYCEVSFHDVYSTSQWIVSHTNEIANAIVKGICNYFGVSYNGEIQSSGEMYRIRKSWADAKSQVGAYRNLENAKNACPSGYYVFNNSGKVVYPVVSNSSVDYAQSFDAAKAKTYTVIADVGLHLRTGASTSKTSLEILPYGAKVQCYGYYTGQWLLIKAPSGNVGYAYSEYLR